MVANGRDSNYETVHETVLARGCFSVTYSILI